MDIRLGSTVFRDWKAYDNKCWYRDTGWDVFSSIAISPNTKPITIWFGQDLQYLCQIYDGPMHFHTVDAFLTRIQALAELL